MKDNNTHLIVCFLLFFLFLQLLGKRQAFDARSATAKNEYLFQLTAINAHLKHYFSEDLPVLAKTLDGELYEKMGEAFTTLCENEIEFCTNTQKRFDALLKEASHVCDIFSNYCVMCPFLFQKFH
ncbi:unnamed protein product [Trichobilharzia regenti]|nr:unnamed protein product [Trichobilharzia regenti]